MADKVIAAVYTSAGVRAGEMTLDPAVFGIEPNVAVMHQVVTAQLAAARAGTADTKTRGEVRGGGKKPWRQKGLGRARQGSIRAPQFRGGGVVFGPHPRDYTQRTPKKMKRLALRSALSDRAAERPGQGGGGLRLGRAQDQAGRRPAGGHGGVRQGAGRPGPGATTPRRARSPTSRR